MKPATENNNLSHEWYILEIDGKLDHGTEFIFKQSKQALIEAEVSA